MSTGLCRGGAVKKSALQALFVAIKVNVMSFSLFVILFQKGMVNFHAVAVGSTTLFLSSQS